MLDVMPRIRTTNVSAAQWSPNGGSLGQADLTQAGAYAFGDNVFSAAIQRQRLPKAAYKQLQETLDSGQPLDAALADAVASAMKEWAMEKGCTHFTHWFQPLTGSTAEKHDSFYNPTGDGNALAEFSGKELIQGEPDASSFPTGGVRATFEARGYTAWDPSSPAFILENPNGALLCIPTAFASWTGEALDHKIPLLRSMDALSRSAIRALKLLGNEDATRVFTTIGPEQEYFLIDERYYFERPDLYTTGRTLFGAKPPKGHELDDHYFGSIPERVLAFMLDAEREMARLGIPIKTRHNEVAPGQYEFAPVFENSNVGSDHQQLCMQILQAVARQYDLVCLLHEKPFAGVNGSGKHNNWSFGTDTGVNLLEPGDTPHENLQFLFFCTAVLEAVDRLADELEAKLSGGAELAEAMLEVLKSSYASHKRIVFNGNNYAEEWYAEAESRGLSNLRQTPDALPALLKPESIEVMGAYDVLSEREMESRYEVSVEQYVAKLNIEAETTFAMAKTLLLPAAIRYLAELRAAGEGAGIATIAAEVSGYVDRFVEAIGELETANQSHPGGEVIEAARYVQHSVVPAMDAVREVADHLERVVPDSLWPLPKYSEILFIK
jgi:glutamine synthetase type III